MKGSRAAPELRWLRSWRPGTLGGMTRRRTPHGKRLLALGAGAITLNLAGCPFNAGNLVVLPCETRPEGCDPSDAGGDAGSTDDAGTGIDAGSPSDAGGSTP